MHPICSRGQILLIPENRQQTALILIVGWKHPVTFKWMIYVYVEVFWRVFTDKCFLFSLLIISFISCVCYIHDVFLLLYVLLCHKIKTLPVLFAQLFCKLQHIDRWLSIVISTNANHTRNCPCLERHNSIKHIGLTKDKRALIPDSFDGGNAIQ